ncbi:acyltransferase [bacterium]|nr:acyltransferase [bacterium]
MSDLFREFAVNRASTPDSTTSPIRRILKTAVNAFATALVLPAVILYRFSAAVIGSEKAFPGWSQAFSLLPGLTGQYLRHAFYSLVLDRCGDGACITFGTIFSHATASVGRNVYIGANCSIGAATIEDDVLIASNVSIMNGSTQHGIERLDIPIREQPGEFVAVTIGEGSWIGERATVAADVGKHCVIGAGAVVTKPIPDYAIALGVPARVVRFRNEETGNDSSTGSIAERVSEAESLVNSLSTENQV